MGGAAQVCRYSLVLSRLPLPQAGTAALPTKARALLGREGNYLKRKDTIREGRELLERDGYY